MVEIPADAPAVCPVCEKPYESVTVHTDGVMVALNDNERYRRVCFDPERHDGDPGLYFYHHTHEQADLERADATP
ncbi:hypothetical protein [Halovenus carboxidivorans]|uniref:hypothetical protein n=1 Tax=Halovenus carboxidivorans TaxID=2692199 RepID=UPI00135B57BA|nr:hypothetical protein [Halovenus carboxidivorans]